MGYCANDGLGYAGGGGYPEGLAGPKRLARLRREGASRAVIQAEKRAMRTRKMARKGVKMATGGVLQRGRFAKLAQKVATGTATRKERRIVGGTIPTEVTAPAIERLTRRAGGSDATRQALADAAEAAAAAEAAREERAAAAALDREQTAADAASLREQNARDREAEREIRDAEREELARILDEDRELAREQAAFEAAGGGTSITYSGGSGGAPWVGGGGLPRDDGAAPAGGLDLGKVLPIAAGAALLFLGS